MQRTRKPITEAEAYNKFSAQCALAEYCPSDIRKKMQRLDIDEDATERVIHHLMNEGFINEDRYAKAFVRDKFHHNRWGRIRIEQELRMKGISQNLIDDALLEIDEDDVRETLLHLMEKKLPSVKGRNVYEIKAKLMRFAMSRGFDIDLIRSVADEVISDTDGIGY